jgi:hypothetical protein
LSEVKRNSRKTGQETTIGRPRRDAEQKRDKPSPIGKVAYENGKQECLPRREECSPTKHAAF